MARRLVDRQSARPWPQRQYGCHPVTRLVHRRHWDGTSAGLPLRRQWRSSRSGRGVWHPLLPSHPWGSTCHSHCHHRPRWGACPVDWRQMQSTGRPETSGDSHLDGSPTSASWHWSRQHRTSRSLTGSRPGPGRLEIQPRRCDCDRVMLVGCPPPRCGRDLPRPAFVARSTYW